MWAMAAVKQAAKASGIALRQIGLQTGKTEQYVNSTMTRNSTPKADTLSQMLEVCGYGLYAIPFEDAPDGALQITYEGQKERADNQ